MVWVKSKSVVKLIQPPEPVASTFLLVCTFAKAGTKEKRERFRLRQLDTA